MTFGNGSTCNRRQNCRDIVLKEGNLMIREQKNPHPSVVPSIQSWGVCCFLQVARTAAQHCMEGIRGGKDIFLPLKSVKGKKIQFRMKCLNTFCRLLQVLIKYNMQTVVFSIKRTQPPFRGPNEIFFWQIQQQNGIIN